MSMLGFATDLVFFFFLVCLRAGVFDMGGFILAVLFLEVVLLVVLVGAVFVPWVCALVVCLSVSLLFALVVHRASSS